MVDTFLEKFNPQGVIDELKRQNEHNDRKIDELSSNVKVVENEKKSGAEVFINKTFSDSKYLFSDADVAITKTRMDYLHQGVKAFGLTDVEARELILKKINKYPSKAQRDRFKEAACEVWGADDGIK
jgi:hypothetical protein